MIELPDINVLFAAHVPSHAHHVVARKWLTECPRFATTPLTEGGLVRLLLNPAATGRRLGPAFALATLSRLKADKHATFWPDDSSLDDPQIDLSILTGAKQVPDLQLVNLAARRSGRLVTLDRHLQESLAPADRSHVKLLVP